MDEKDIASTRLLTPPILLRKRFPARRVGEEARVPAGQVFNVFEREFGRIAVLICSDIIDVNQFLTIMQINRTKGLHQTIDYVIVPSFNKSRALSNICRHLSAVSSNTVIVVNANHYLAEFPDTELYCCGFDSSELETLPKFTEPVVKKHVEKIQHPNGRESAAIHFSLNCSALQIWRETLSDQLDDCDNAFAGSIDRLIGLAI
jgi:hypothetical protein